MKNVKMLHSRYSSQNISPNSTASFISRGASQASTSREVQSIVEHKKLRSTFRAFIAFSPKRPRLLPKLEIPDQEFDRQIQREAEKEIESNYLINSNNLFLNEEERIMSLDSWEIGKQKGIK